MIIEGDEADRRGEVAQPEGAEVVEIAGAVEGEGAELRLDGLVEGVEELGSGAVAEAWAPLAEVEVVDRGFRATTPRRGRRAPSNWAASWPP